MMSQRLQCLILLLVLFSCAPFNSTENVDYPSSSTIMSEWHEFVSDPNKICQPTKSSVETLAKDNFGDLLIFEVDPGCRNQRSRWDYRFKTNARLKRPLVFQGWGTMTFPVKVERDNFAGEYVFGIKYGKCIVLADDNIKSVSGRFVDDSLDGGVEIAFHNSTTLRGWAERNHLKSTVVPTRIFDENGVLERIHMSAGTSQVERVQRVAELEGVYVVQMRNDVTYVTETSAAGDNNMYVCTPISRLLLRDCNKIDDFKPAIDIPSCRFDLKVRQSTHALKATVDTEDGFHWNLGTGDKLWKSSHKESIFTFEWTDVEPEAKLREWLSAISDPNQGPPFWSEVFFNSSCSKESNGPIDKANPIVEVDLPELRSIAAPQVEVTLERHFITGVDEFPMDYDEERGVAGLFVRDPDNPAWQGEIKIQLINHVKLRKKNDVVGSHDSDFVGIIGRLCGGRLHGHVQRFIRILMDPCGYCGEEVYPGLSHFGLYDLGKPIGPSWRATVGGGLVYGKDGEDLAFVYPDMRTAIFGQFTTERGTFVRGREAEVARLRSVQGILEIEFTEPEGPYVRHSLPAISSFGDGPQITDPIDKRYITVKESDLEHDLASQGAFAKEDIAKGTLIAIYTGYIMSNTEASDLWIEAKEEMVAQGLEKTDAKWQMWGKYVGDHFCGHTIYIPVEYGSLKKYNATLGHKLNHSFRANARTMPFDSPRFGLVQGIFTTRDVKRGEELFINYGYRPGKAPDWYRQLYNETFGGL